MQNSPVLRVGLGHDLHRTVAGRPLVMGGVTIDSPFGLDGHSDADVLLHAVIDALLGATGNGDIGGWFPDSDDHWKRADSAEMLRHVLRELRFQNWRIENLDCTITAEQPRLENWKPTIRERLAELMDLNVDLVNVKAKSGEKVGPIGRGEAIAADAIVLMSR